MNGERRIAFTWGFHFEEERGELFLHFIEDLRHKEAFLELARRLANSDGFVNRNETNYIRAWELELGMVEWEPSAELQAMPISELVGSLENEQIRNLFFAELLLLVFADGRFEDPEKHIADELNQLFGFTDEQYAAFIDWVLRMDRLKIEGINLILNRSTN